MPGHLLRGHSLRVAAKAEALRRSLPQGEDLLRRQHTTKRPLDYHLRRPGLKEWAVLLASLLARLARGERQRRV